MSIKVYLADDLGQNFIQDRKKIKKLSQNFLDNFSIKGYQLGVHLITQEEIRRINQSYRNKNEKTDVISFPIDEPLKNKGKLNEEHIILGDVFIAPQVVKKQTEKDFKKEFIKVLKHGLVHLLGFDHKSKQEQEKFDKIMKGNVV